MKYHPFSAWVMINQTVSKRPQQFAISPGTFIIWVVHFSVFHNNLQFLQEHLEFGWWSFQFFKGWLRNSIFSRNTWLFQFVIFNPWKFPWNWEAFSQNSFVISSGLLWLYHLIRRDSGRLANEAFTSNAIVSLKQ